MQGAFSFPMTADRSRNKERIEASLAGLCKLELLKQRQECLVLSALSFGDPVPGHPAQGDLRQPRSALSGPNREQDDLTLRCKLSSLQCAPCGLVAAVEQQVGELKVDTESSRTDSLGDAGDSRPSSGFYEQSEGQSPPSFSDPYVCNEPPPDCAQAMWMASVERPKSVGDIFAADRGGLLDYVPCRAVPRSFSVPHTSLKDIAEGGEVEPWPWDPSYPAGFESEATAEDFQQAMRVEKYILGLIQRYVLAPQPSKSCSSLALEARTDVRRRTLCGKEALPATEHCGMSRNLGGHLQTCHSVEPKRSRGVALARQDFLPLLCARPTPSHLHDLRQASLDFSRRALEASGGKAGSNQCCRLPHSHQIPDERLVNAQYIPSQAYQTPACDSTRRPQVFYTSGWTLHASEPSQPRPGTSVKKYHLGVEGHALKKQRQKACRSQSENSLLDHRSAELRYNTVEQDQVIGSQVQPQRLLPVSPGSRCWHSTQELNQDEAEPLAGHASRHGHKSHPSHTYSNISRILHPHQRAEYTDHMVSHHPAEHYTVPSLGDAESSMSEADSPGSSSVSSYSDESGGLVWPQQLLPRLAPPLAPAHPEMPGAFTKIKASQALKKKILRFRNGSLKVMTTV